MNAVTSNELLNALSHIKNREVEEVVTQMYELIVSRTNILMLMGRVDQKEMRNSGSIMSL